MLQVIESLKLIKLNAELSYIVISILRRLQPFIVILKENFSMCQLHIEINFKVG